MIGYLALLILQIVSAVFATPVILKHVPLGGDIKFFLMAAIYAVIVWLAGVVGAQILKDVRMPSSSTLALSLGLALIFAAVVKFLPDLVSLIPLNIPKNYYPLIGAVLGYMIRR